MKPITFNLKTPIKLTESSPEIKELVFARRPKARDFKGMAGEIEQDENMLMLSRLTDTEMAVIEKLDGHDYLRACGVIRSFLGAGPKAEA